MIYIVLSILASAILGVSFKLLEKLNINSFQAIVVNYFVASSLGFLTSGSTLSFSETLQQPWISLGIGLGLVFIIILNVISITSQKIGITVASVANKMSIVIPVLFAVYKYNDELNAAKIIGLLLALVAVFLTAYKGKDQQGPAIDKKLLIFPVLIFFGSGLIDTCINYAQRNYLGSDNASSSLFLSFIFGTAGILGFSMLMVKLIKGEKFEIKALGAGIILGTINYGTMYFVIKSLDTGMKPSMFFPVNNMGILVLATIIAFLGFKEKLSTINWAGIVLAVASIGIIAFL